MVARKRATLDWLVARLSTSSKKKKKIHHGTIQPSFSSTISPSSTSLSLSLSFLSPFLSVSVLAPFFLPHHSSHVRAPSLYKRARATTCFLLSPPLDRVQRVPLHNPSTGSRPALFHTPFSLRCFLTCPFLQCVITYVHLRLFLLLFLFSASPQLLTQLLSSRIGRTLSAEVA